MQPNDGRVVSSFIVQALRNEQITVFGDGSQARSFCYVDDLIDGLVRMMESGDDFVGPVNMGSTEEFSMNDLAAKVLALTGSSSKVVYGPLPEDDPAQRRPDLTLAREKLGWQPGVSLETGLGRTIDYFCDTLGLGASDH
jgi:UDP-glucuronate decarboxylase